MESRRAFQALIILAKAGKILKAAKALKFLKLAKPLLTLGSMALSAFVYAFMLGPWFSVGLVLMLFIHEMGHVWAMQLKGMPARAPVFIPLLGAVIFAPPFSKREDEAFVGYGGPLVGGLAGVLLFGIWYFIPGKPEILLLISYTAIFINLFNLIPIKPLDGGRVTQITGDWFKYIGIAFILLITAMVKQPGILLIWILILTDFNWSKKLKAVVGVACHALMLFLMIMGYGEEPFWVCVVDNIVAAFINFLLIGDIHFGNDLAQAIELPPAPFNAKVAWLTRYVALVIGLWFVMVVQAQYLPKEVKQRGGTMMNDSAVPEKETVTEIPNNN